MTYGELPFGCRDCKIAPWTTVIGTGIDVPRIRTVELNVTRDSTDLEGDDVKIATHTFAKGLEGSIEAGGINPAVLVVLEGGEVTTGGTGATAYTIYNVEGDQAEGYFALEAQMYADDGGDTHFTAWRVKATNGPNYSFGQGEFALTQCDLSGVFDESVSPSRLYSIKTNATVKAIQTSDIGDLTPGS